MAVILGSNANVIFGAGNTVGPGTGHNVVLGCTSLTLTGGLNCIAHVYNKTWAGIGGVVLGGYYNSFDAGVTDCTGMVVVGGYSNVVRVSSPNSIMIGGKSNQLRGENCVVLGGTFLEMETSCEDSVILGGKFNTIYGTCLQSVIVGGIYGEIAAGTNGACILGGYTNSIDAGAHNSVVCGYRCSVGAGAQNSFACGSRNLVNASVSHAMVMGIRSRVTRSGEFGHNSVDFKDYTTNTYSLDRGYHRFTGNVKTTNDTVTNILTITLVASVAYCFRITIVANESGGGNRASYVRRVTAYRDGSAAAALQGSVEVVGTDVESDAAWDVTIDVDTNDLRVRATGKALTNINWGAVVEWVGLGEVVN